MQQRRISRGRACGSRRAAGQLVILVAAVVLVEESACVLQHTPVRVISLPRHGDGDGRDGSDTMTRAGGPPLAAGSMQRHQQHVLLIRCNNHVQSMRNRAQDSASQGRVSEPISFLHLAAAWERCCAKGCR